MFIAECQIQNFKGFRKSNRIKFNSGFNVVVGQNNAGKTALTETLSLRFKSNPHRSLITPAEGHSSIRLELSLSLDEGYDFIRALGRFLIPLSSTESPESTIARFEKYVKSGLKVECEYKPNQEISMGGSFSNQKLIGLKIDGQSNIVVRCAPEANIILRDSSIPVGQSKSLADLTSNICSELRRRIYIFRAERLNVHQSSIGTRSVLASDAGNLPEVLHFLQSSNRYRFQRFVDDVRTVFPDIQDVVVTPISANATQINVWFIDPKTERKDLAIPLSDCGTGIGQVLAMLYVVIDSDEQRTIIIDEPQSFLHPGAIRKLFEIFKRERNQKHQYIVTTHSPTVVTACSPCNVILLTRQNNESKAQTIDINETAEVRMFLSEIGARLSDVFGADKILWVEGRTEEICFPKIITKLLKIELLATEIIGVTHVGDLTGRHREAVLEIYQKLCQSRGLLPPALSFCFDREKLSEAEMNDLGKDSRGLIKFLPRRMYENYLINPDAVAAVLSEADKSRSEAVTKEQVVKWLEDNKFNIVYVSASDHGDWLKKCDAAKLLNDLFNALTDARVRFDKLNHGVKLTDWIIQNSPQDFEELGDFLKTILK